MDLSKLEKYAKPTVRIALALVFISFGIMEILNPLKWSGFVPSFALAFGMSAILIVKINAIVEMALGLFMLLGLYTRFASLVLSIHLFVIAATLGLNDLAVRDFGLAFATLSTFFAGHDQWSLDHKFEKKQKLQVVSQTTPQNLNMP